LKHDVFHRHVYNARTGAKNCRARGEFSPE
jgi:hypothetical protein